jgi:succinyl-CoA synthetase alpha subunit
MRLLETDPETEAVVLYGEPGGVSEEQLANHLTIYGTRLRINAFLAGRFVDEMEGVRFGHAAVIVEGMRGSVNSKAEALRAAGVFVADCFDDILEGLPK